MTSGNLNGGPVNAAAEADVTTADADAVASLKEPRPMSTVVPLATDPHIWSDPSEPLTVPNPAGRRAIVDVATASGARPTGFAVEYRDDGRLTVRWSSLFCDMEQGLFDAVPHAVPLPTPAGPLFVQVISPA